MQLIRFLPVLALLATAGTAQALPTKQIYDDDIVLRRAGFESLGSVLLPVGAATAADYTVAFSFDFVSEEGTFEGDFDRDGIADIATFRSPGRPPRAALGFRLIAAAAGEAENTVVNIPYVTETEGSLANPIDPSTIALLLPAVQKAINDGGAGGTCEPPPEPVCEPPPDQSGPFEPVDWLIFDFGEPLHAANIIGSYLFAPRAQDFGPNDMALEIHYLTRTAVDEPATAMLVLTGLGLVSLRLWRQRAKRPARPARRDGRPAWQ